MVKNLERYKNINWILIIKKYDWYLFILLMSVSVSNTYIGTLVVLSIFALKTFSIVKMPLKVYKQYKLILLLIFIGSISFFINYSSFQNYLWGLFTISSFALYPLVINYNYSSIKFKNTIKLFVLIQFIFFLFQFIQISRSLGSFNIFYLSISAGDSFKGTADNTHQLSISLAFISFYFLQSFILCRKGKELFWTIFSILMFTICGYMSAIFSFLVVLLAVFIWSLLKNIVVKSIIKKIDLKILFLLITLFFVVIGTQYRNVNYGYNSLAQIFANEKPRKVQGIVTTIEDFSKEKWYIPMIGVGIGNYSSRAALIVGGEYLSNQPSWILATPSRYTSKYIIPLWNRKLVSIPYMDGTANQPFVQYQSIYGEMGLIGLIIFIYVIIKISFINKGLCPNYYLPYFLLCFCCLIFWVDMWIEYTNFVLFFWLFATHKMEPT